MTDKLKRLASEVQLRPWPPHFKELSGLACCASSPFSVRSRAGSPVGSWSQMIVKNLAQTASFSVRSQSAFVRRMAENRSQHCPCRSHAILTDSVTVELKCQLDIAVTKQSLHGFWIGLDADEERCKAVT